VIIKPTIRAHIIWKLSEAEFYLRQLKHASKEIFGSIRPLDFGWTNADHQGKAQVFLFLFSAFLSPLRCVTFYIKKTCENQKPPSRWYKEQIKKAVKERSLLAAFCFLRDSDVHDQALSGTPGVRHKVDLSAQTATSEFTLNENTLLTIEALKKHRWAAELLAGDSVVAISESALAKLSDLVQEGIQAGLF
jgi:hypothetical protein